MGIMAGFMVPHPPVAVAEIGNGEEKKIQATLDSYDEVAREIASLAPDTIIITSPHSVMYGDYFHISPGRGAAGDFGQFRAPQVQFKVSYDDELVQKISDICGRTGFPAGTDGERQRELDHGTMVPLYFINKRYTDFKLVRIGLSGLSLENHYRFGRMISEAVQALGRKAVFVASGDLSHCQKEDGPYGFKPEGPEYDRQLMDVMGRGAFDELLKFDEGFLEKSEECGHRSFVIMAGALDGKKISAKVLSHENTFGVGYGFGIYRVTGEKVKETSADPYVKLAHDTIVSYIRDRHTIQIPDGLPEEMLSRRAGTFVSIHENGMLRGCIGTIAATRASIALEIIGNAVSAATRDPRFRPIEADELDSLEISVDVLGPTEPVDGPSELDVKKYGVIVTKDMRRGLLLPNLDGVDTVAEQISIAKQKAGIRENEEVQLERFEVVRHI